MLPLITIIALMLQIDFTGISLRLKKENSKTLVFDPIRKKWVVLTPEEHVRQFLLQYFIEYMRYPASLIAVEKKILVGSMDKRFDIVVYNREHKPWLLAECKAPDVTVDEKTLYQLLNYNNTLQCKYWLVGNGHTHYCADAVNITAIQWLNELPGYNS
ncbi:MAG: type I restriction enzyme HsdR N-terminal domain-containing protein [Chitinophagaceae bacterium]|nr:type I restriction enzyme HsdR N-terminal domain-containing protein [Chitinophagaceae bacterium]MCB9045550.1 type I restriction enzyme HsdR N-terminal domain-containing protein [Chitinophagales bacterium]